MPKLLGEQQKVEHIYWLAWKALQTNGHVVKLFTPEFLDTLVSAELDADSSFESTATA